MAKVPAEVRAAWIRRAGEISEMPSSSRTWAPIASFAMSSSATWRASASSIPRSMVTRVSSPAAPRASAGGAVVRGPDRRFGVKLGTDGHIFVSSHRHRSRNQPDEPRRQHLAARGCGRRDADPEARGADDAIIGSEHGHALPSDPGDEAVLGMATWQGSISFGW